MFNATLNNIYAISCPSVFGADWVPGVIHCHKLLTIFITKLLTESLNSDGQQYHHYQQNEQSSLTFIHWTQKGGGDHNNNVRNTGPVLKQAQKCVGGGGGLR